MGIYYSGVIVVGLPFEDLCQNSDEFYEKYEGKLDRVSPYYDADNDACLIGIVYDVSKDYQFKELPIEPLVFEKIKELFKSITGKDAKVYLGPWGT